MEVITINIQLTDLQSQNNKFMRFGFIGAGKVGFSLGKYFSDNNLNLSGYYSKNINSAKEAAMFTNSNYYTKLDDIIKNSDVIFITTPDGIIKSVWDSINKELINNKIICHCSGSLSSEVFSNIENHNSYGYSIQPLFAFSVKYNSHKTLNKAFVTIEGSQEYINYFIDIFTSLGNKVKVISKENKDMYHTSAVVVSNQIVALIKIGIDLLIKCGFNEDEANEALYPLIVNNINNIHEKGVIDSLTGPIERCDIETVKKHLLCLNNEDKKLYKMLSKRLIEISKIKNKNRDYTELENVIGE